MSSEHRPSATRRLPSSDLENSYFRAWVLRGSEGSSPAGRGGNAYSNPPSPRSVPPPVGSPQNRRRISDRYGQQSENSLQNGPVAHSPLQITDSIFPLRQSVGSAQQTAIAARTPSQVSGASEERSSARSSIKSVAEKLRKISLGRDKLGSSDERRPSPEARTSVQWKHEISSPWFEIRIGKKRPSNETFEGPPSPIKDAVQSSAPIVQPVHTGTPSSAPNTRSVHTSSTTPRNQCSKETSRAESRVPSHVFQSSRERSSASSVHKPVYSATPKAGLYHRAKRAIGLKKNGDHRDNVYAGRTATGEVLDKTSLALKQLVDRMPNTDRRPENPSPSTSASTLSIAAQHWHHLRLGGPSSGRSSASSVQSVSTGRPLVPTPESRSLYTGPDHRQYLAVELTDPDAPAFLPSEARRVTTPPLSDVYGHTIRSNKKLRGFFFDYSAPTGPGGRTDAAETPYVETPGFEGYPLPPEFRQRAEADRVERRDWYRAKMEAIDADGEDGGELSREEFVLQVPEHLPNSPMCPRHPRNKSGGKGVCVYHGRNIAVNGNAGADHAMGDDGDEGGGSGGAHKPDEEH